MDIKQKINQLYAHKDVLTEVEKAEVKMMCKEAGIKTSFNKRCPNCYADAVLLLMLHYGVKAEDNDDVLTPSGHFVFHNGRKKVVWWYRHSYTELSAQSDDATIVRYMAVHPKQKHFSRVEPEPTDETENGGNGTENAEQNEGGVTEQSETENVSEGQNIGNNEGVNDESDNSGKEQGDETNE